MFLVQYLENIGLRIFIKYNTYFRYINIHEAKKFS